MISGQQGFGGAPSVILVDIIAALHQAGLSDNVGFTFVLIFIF